MSRIESQATRSLHDGFESSQEIQVRQVYLCLELMTFYPIYYFLKKPPNSEAPSPQVIAHDSKVFLDERLKLWILKCVIRQHL